MENELVSIELAKLAEKKGLKRKLSFGGYLPGYNLTISKPYPTLFKVHIELPSEEEFLYAPTRSRLAEWLREEHNIDVVVISKYDGNPNHWFVQVENFTHQPPEADMYSGKLLWESERETFLYNEAWDLGLEEALNRI